ncbi:hypothetical protein C3486_31135 [Streptomyces sp. Ru73]|uniref:hypothetical protein n=1 Tax=Streptomyces sp. Ru73 TaxID=2080748 RepID=UPI000CDD82ED|nr:hypothetical protein [Streptomyces sp. Ru73]POX36888.1 hypothetical protein C3486_31135 [Streptomyces sp. Ru73]
MTLSVDRVQRHLVPTVLPCHLCPEPAPALPELAVTLRPAIGPERTVWLCRFCQDTRPGRDRPVLGGADWSWRGLNRGAAALRTAFATGQWVPLPAEHRFAEALRRARWTESSVRDLLRRADPALRTGRLVPLLQDALTVVLAHAPAGDVSLREVRRLIDALAAAPAPVPDRSARAGRPPVG